MTSDSPDTAPESDVPRLVRRLEAVATHHDLMTSDLMRDLKAIRDSFDEECEIDRALLKLKEGYIPLHQEYAAICREAAGMISSPNVSGDAGEALRPPSCSPD